MTSLDWSALTAGLGVGLSAPGSENETPEHGRWISKLGKRR